MKNLSIAFCLMAALFLGACGSSDSTSYDKSLSPANATKPVTPLTITDTLLSDTATTSASINRTPVINQNPTTVSAVTNTTQALPSATKMQSSPAVVKTASGLNPAHGEPGHRCDISVGAPLNSPATTTATPKLQNAPVNITPGTIPANPSPVTGTGSGKLNPAHGQPGHDCAVAVGAPLKN